MENRRSSEYDGEDGEKNCSPVWLYINFGSNYPHVKKQILIEIKSLPVWVTKLA